VNGHKPPKAKPVPRMDWRFEVIQCPETGAVFEIRMIAKPDRAGRMREPDFSTDYQLDKIFDRLAATAQERWAAMKAAEGG
jgi:hypothetical protein